MTMTEYNQPESGNEMPQFSGRTTMFRLPAADSAENIDIGIKVAHGTVFRRAIEEALVGPEKMFQVDLRATGYSAEDFDWARSKGATVISAEECWYKSLSPLMDSIRGKLGKDHLVYLSFDIDGVDPPVAPETGTPEPAGLMASQGLEIIRGTFGLNIVGCDLVEVSPHTIRRKTHHCWQLISFLKCSVPCLDVFIVCLESRLRSFMIPRHEHHQVFSLRGPTFFDSRNMPRSP